MESGASSNLGYIIALITFVFSIISGLVIALIAPNRPTFHSIVYATVLTIYVGAMSINQPNLSLTDIFLVWLQAVPGAVFGAFLFERYLKTGSGITLRNKRLI